MFTRASSKKLLRIFIITIVAIVVIGYAGFAFRDLVRGPSITLSEPTNGETFSTSSITVRGNAVRVQDIRLNGRSILIDEQGNFSEVLPLYDGYNVALLEANDKFGHVTKENLELIRK